MTSTSFLSPRMSAVNLPRKMSSCGGVQARAAVRAMPAIRSHRALFLPTTTAQKTGIVCKATEDEQPETSSTPPSGEAKSEDEPVDPQVEAAQRTAIVTGAISIVIAFAYLALAQFLGNRELLPPPPEALGL